MSADNYVLVNKTPDGRFAVSHRFASCYYSDEIDGEPPFEYSSLEGTAEGWRARGDSNLGDQVFETIEELNAAATRRPDWVENPPNPQETFDDPQEAVMFAHRFVKELDIVEYGVIVGEGVV